MIEPSASTIATSITCEEISVRSASAWGASMRLSILRGRARLGSQRRQARSAGPGGVREVLRRPRHPPRGDDRLLRPAVLRAAALPLALDPRRGQPGRPGVVLRAGAAAHLPE